MPAAVRLRSPCAHLRQQWAGLDLDAPALVLGEVPMQDVHPVQGQRLNLLFDEAHILEVAASIEQQPAVLEDRRILDPNTGQNESFGAPCFAFDRHHFAKGGPPAEPPGRVWRHRPSRLTHPPRCGIPSAVLDRSVRLEDEVRQFHRKLRSKPNLPPSQTSPPRPRARPPTLPANSPKDGRHTRTRPHADSTDWEVKSTLPSTPQGVPGPAQDEKENKQKQGHRIPEPVRHHALKVGQRHEPPRPTREPSFRPPGFGRHRRVGPRAHRKAPGNWRAQLPPQSERNRPPDRVGPRPRQPPPFRIERSLRWRKDPPRPVVRPTGQHRSDTGRLQLSTRLGVISCFIERPMKDDLGQGPQPDSIASYQIDRSTAPLANNPPQTTLSAPRPGPLRLLPRWPVARWTCTRNPLRAGG